MSDLLYRLSTLEPSGNLSRDAITEILKLQKQLEELQAELKEKDNTIENLRENFAFQKFEFIRLAGELDKKEAQNKILKETLNYIIELDILGNDNQSKMVFVTREALEKVREA